MHGKLATVNLTGGFNTVIYTAPATCVMAEVNINILNKSGSPAAISVAATMTPLAPTADEWIESGITLSVAGVYNNDKIMLSPGESISVTSTQSNVVVRVSGSEKTKI